jgi:glycosyltransferase involved in cell wall biosynthesis
MKEKILLTVIIICCNSERTIERTLKSVKDLADEIIVVDSGSEDRTVEIAKQYGAKVFFREWINAENQYNYAFTLASGEWIFLIDSDEEATEELQESIKKVIQGNTTVDCYMVNRRTYYLGDFVNHAWQPEWRIRLFKKGKVRFEERVHGAAICEGVKGRLKGDLYHYSYKDLPDQFQRAIYFAQQFSEQMVNAGKKAKFRNIIVNPIVKFLKLYFLKKGFLDGKRGFMIAVSGFIHTFLKYAFFYEKKLRKRYGDSLWIKKDQ